MYVCIYIYTSIHRHIPNHSCTVPKISQRYPPPRAGPAGPMAPWPGPRAADGCHCHGPSDDDAVTKLQMGVNTSMDMDISYMIQMYIYLYTS